jgi:hypothetical protein
MLRHYFHFPAIQWDIAWSSPHFGHTIENPRVGKFGPAQPAYANMKGELVWYVHFSFS